MADHIDAAKADVYPRYVGDPINRVPQAQVHALIAIAEEQRTANLITWHLALLSQRDGRPGLRSQIEARLGLTNESE